MNSTHNPRQIITKFAKDHNDVPELEFISADPDGVIIKEISDGDGLVNFVYRVRSQDGKQSIILKYGENRIKAVPSQTVSLDRQVWEYNSLVLMDSIEPGSVPKPYCLDRKHNIVAMEDMQGWALLANQLEAGIVDQNVAVYLGHLLANFHQATSKNTVSPQRWEELRHQYRVDSSMIALIDAYTWEKPYVETDEINKIPAAGLESYRQYVLEITKLGLDKRLSHLFRQEHCFIHADCHWKSVFVKDGKAVLFDWEFAFLSHPGENVGFMILAYYMYHVITQNQKSRDNASLENLRSMFKQAVGNFLTTYIDDQNKLTEPERLTFLTEIALFTGGCMFSSSIFSGTEGFTNITDADRVVLMHTAFRLMKLHNSLTSVDKIVSTLFDDQQ